MGAASNSEFCVVECLRIGGGVCIQGGGSGLGEWRAMKVLRMTFAEKIRLLKTGPVLGKSEEKNRNSRGPRKGVICKKTRKELCLWRMLMKQKRLGWLKGG